MTMSSQVKLTWSGSVALLMTSNDLNWQENFVSTSVKKLSSYDENESKTNWLCLGGTRISRCVAHLAQWAKVPWMLECKLWNFLEITIQTFSIELMKFPSNFESRCLSVYIETRSKQLFTPKHCQSRFSTLSIAILLGMVEVIEQTYRNTNNKKSWERTLLVILLRYCLI